MSSTRTAMVPIFLLAAVVSNAEPAVVVEQPGSYCASTNDDHIKPIPAELVGAAIRLFGLHPDAAKWVRETTVYRCMDGAAWLCNHGANLTCAKADTRRNLPSVTDYCRENTNEEFVPMAVTGHGTIYNWECVDGKPRSKPSERVDERGFIADQWKRLE